MRTETLNAAGTALVAASEQDWTQRIGLNWSAYTTYAQEQPENDNRVNQDTPLSREWDDGQDRDVLRSIQQSD